jgi:hypothetical protein
VAGEPLNGHGVVFLEQEAAFKALLNRLGRDRHAAKLLSRSLIAPPCRYPPRPPVPPTKHPPGANNDLMMIKGVVRPDGPGSAGHPYFVTLPACKASSRRSQLGWFALVLGIAFFRCMCVVAWLPPVMHRCVDGPGARPLSRRSPGRAETLASSYALLQHFATTCCRAPAASCVGGGCHCQPVVRRR